MTITVEQTGNGASVATLSGDVDLGHAPAVRAALLKALETRPVLVVDMGDVSYIDSSGVACLVEAYHKSRQNNGRLALARVSPAALRVLQLARLDRVFPLRDSVEAALAG